MPVVTPSRASTEIVYAVRSLSLVVRRHQRDLEPVEHVGRHRHADHAAGVADRERHQLRRRLAGGEDQVALVLAVLVVDDDDGLAGGDVGDRPLDGVEPDRRARSCRSPSSRLGLPRPRAARQPHQKPQTTQERRRRRTGSRSGSTPSASSSGDADHVDGDPGPVRREPSREAAGEQLLDVLGDDVDLEVDPVAGLLGAEGGAGQGLGDQADGEARRRRPRPRSGETPSTVIEPLSTR